MAAAYRSLGIDATVTPDSNDETLDLGGLHSGGEECLPHKITLGDFVRVCRSPGFDPAKAAFFMPRSSGPCRFGQYAPYLKQVLHELGYGGVLVVSPTSNDSYDGIGGHGGDLMRIVWMSIVAAEVALKLLHRTRPYETNAGDSDAVFAQSVDELEGVIARPGLEAEQKLHDLVGMVEQIRDRFRAVPAQYMKGRPLIGLVGEIYCRVNTFANEDIARRIEQLGGECWLSDLMEWIWYTNWGRETDLLRDRGWFNLDYLKIKLKSRTQHRYEHALTAPVTEDLKGYEEPHDVREVLTAAEPYLPPTGALGEMVLSVGKGIYYYRKGVDGVIDISPFTCMNGIVCEAIYPVVSRDHDDLPIRTCYFDKVNTQIDRDLEIFLDLARAYQQRKRRLRVYPDCFE
jgi:predicted nucleotide-binding protein (sugar kinase/HSP70/actin superfamily)